MTAPKDWRTHRVPEKCEAVLKSIARFRRLHHDYGPSIEEIREDTGISSTGLVDGYMKRLRRLDLIKYREGVSRSVQLTDRGWHRADVMPPCFTTRG